MTLNAPILLFFAVLLVLVGAVLLYESGRNRRLLREKLQRIGSPDRATAPDEPHLIRNKRYSAIPPFEKLLSAGRAGEAISLFLSQANVSLSVGSFLLLTMIVALAGYLIGAWLSGMAGVGFLLFLLLALVPYAVVAGRRRKRFEKFLGQFPDALGLIANALRAGLAFSGAMRIVAQEMPDPVGGEFWVVTEEHNLGLDLKEALGRMNRRVNLPDVRFFVTAVILQRETGGNLAEILENTTDIIRDRFRILSEARVFSAQGRLSGIILILLPITMVIILSFLSPGYMQILTDDPVGKYMLGAAVFLQVVGIFTIRKIVRIRV